MSFDGTAPSPDVSVIIAHYNSGGDVLNAIKSALDQTGLTLEVVVVDDCSTDGSDQSVSDLADQDARVRLFRLPLNSGPAAARNHAIQQSRGRFIAILDADDSFLPGRLARLVEMADRRTADAIADNMIVTNSQGSCLAFPQEWMQESAPLSITKLLQRGTPWEIGGLPIGYMKPLLSRAFLSAHAIAYDERLRISEDFMLYFDLLKAGGRLILDDSEGYVAVARERSLSHGDDTVHRRVLQTHDAIAAKLRDGSKGEKAALAHRRDALTLEVAISDLRRGDIAAGALAVLDIRPSYLLRKTVRACVKRLGRRRTLAPTEG